MSDVVDFLIITPLEEERDAFLNKLPEFKKHKPAAEDIRTYYSSELPVTFSDGSAGSYDLIVMPLLGMGRVEATAATMDAVRRWNPRYVIALGIAGGIAESNVKLGDVLVSDQIVDYEEQKLKPEGPKIRWQVYRTNPRLLGAVQNFTDESWLRLVTVKRPDDGTPSRHIGAIASGDKIIACSKVLAHYRDTWPKLVGVEMEGTGVALASFQSPASPGFIMIRAVSDLADSDKDSPDTRKWRQYACHVAASYTVALLQSGPVPSQIPKEIPIEIFILYQSRLLRTSATLGHETTWPQLFTLIMIAFGHHPVHLPNNRSAYVLLDLDSEEWRSPPATMAKLRTSQIALIHKSELSKAPEMVKGHEAKWFARTIKSFGKM